MTTGQTISPFEQADSARPDDGAPAEVPASRPPATDDEADPRLSLSPIRGQGSFDGGWWPRTLTLAGELPGLIAALTAAGESVTRVSVNGETWAPVPTQVAGPDRRRVRVSWFRTIDPWVVTLGGGGGEKARIRLLVVPPDTAAGPADAVLRLVTGDDAPVGSASQILSAARAGTTTSTSSRGTTSSTVAASVAPESAPALLMSP